eukprot:1328452-Rhodomonas_salina.3
MRNRSPLHVPQLSSQPGSVHCRIKYQKPQFQDILYQGCGFLYLILPCNNGLRSPSAGCVTRSTSTALHALSVHQLHFYPSPPPESAIHIPTISQPDDACARVNLP